MTPVCVDGEIGSFSYESVSEHFRSGGDGVAATNLSNTRGRGRLFPPHIEVRDETRHEHQIERTAPGHLVINAHVAAIQ
jgi:hypothetical protein